jgi:hypothetical protein
METRPDRPVSRPRSRAVALERRDVLPGVSRPKLYFLLAATLSFFLSVFLFFGGDHERGIFVGIWVPSILSAGALLLGQEARDE